MKHQFVNMDSFIIFNVLYQKSTKKDEFVLALHEFRHNICIFREFFSFQLSNKLPCWSLNRFDKYHLYH